MSEITLKCLATIDGQLAVQIADAFSAQIAAGCKFYIDYDLNVICVPV